MKPAVCAGTEKPVASCTPGSAALRVGSVDQPGLEVDDIAEIIAELWPPPPGLSVAGGTGDVAPPVAGRIQRSGVPVGQSAPFVADACAILAVIGEIVEVGFDITVGRPTVISKPTSTISPITANMARASATKGAD